MWKVAFGLLLTCSLVHLEAGVTRHPLDWVNPLIGTANGGQTFPATGVPFGMTQWTPQTRSGEDKCIAPYYATDTKIQGFRGTHFPSGSCTQDFGSVTLMPVLGTPESGPEQRASAFSRSTELMTPYLYAVTLSRYRIRVEMTATARSAIFRFRFERGGRGSILVQTNREGTVQIDPARDEITAVNPVRRIYAGKGQFAGISGYSVVVISRHFRNEGTTQNGNAIIPASGTASSEGYVSFDVKPGETIEARVGTSFTSLEEARRNLQAEIPDWNFEAIRDQSKTAWNAVLDKVQAIGNPSKLRILYTALYHCFLDPSIFNDADGTYPKFAGGESLESSPNRLYYDNFSLWDTYRALHPLLTILDPDRDGDMIESLIEKGRQGGFLPIYPAWNSYTSEMVGDDADAVIADAYFKGIRNFDVEEAYRLMRKNALEIPRDRRLYVDGRGRRALTSYLRFGYIPLDDPVAEAPHMNEQVSRTLEYAYDDFLVGKMARALGKTKDAEIFEKRAKNYHNVIDPKIGFARGRKEDGSWSSPFDPAARTSYLTEGTPHEYTFAVPQDIPGLIGLLGGPKAFTRKLDALFSDGHYEQGNEPGHQIAYLYDFVGAAWKTQKQVHEIMTTRYFDGRGGLPGNDDCGQMSAWYILSAFGFYPVTPGVPRYSIGTPGLDDIVLVMPGGKRLHISAHGVSSGKFFIRSATLNGLPLTHPWIEHAAIMQGGELKFEMSAKPCPDWGKEQ